MENAIIVCLTTLPALVVAAVVAANAKKLNAEWKRRRDAKLAARATA